jgi:hypothetical protein
LRAVGEVVAWNETYVVRNLAHHIDMLTHRLPYYLESYTTKPGKGPEVFGRRLRDYTYCPFWNEAGR